MYIVAGSHPQLVLTLGLHNSASVPVTVTGIDPIGGEGGPLTRVRLGEGDPHNLSATGGPFHPVRIPADGYGTLTLVFGVNPAILSCGQIISLGDVTFRFTTLGVIHGTQALDLGDQSPSFAGACQ